MPSHFSTIGLPVATHEDLLALANRLVENAKPIHVPNGRYLRWSSQCGAEIWLQLGNDNALIGMAPHFAGESRVRVGIMARVTRPNDTPLDGAFHGWADPVDDDPANGSYPFVFDSPDYVRHSTLVIPSIVQVQIAAFAQEISVFDSVDAYDASETHEPKFASQSFIPSGLFSPDGESTEPPKAHAIFTGHVVNAATKRNELTGRSYYWALVHSLGGTYDVVIDPELTNVAPEKGGVLTGSFWLSGRLATENA